MLGWSAEQLIAEARQETGLADFGDGRFLDGLRRLVAGIEAESALSPRGVLALRERMRRLLRNQLRFRADLAAYPEILEQELRAPVFVQGLPRVGSTKLHRLLAESGCFQSLLFWQVYNHARVPGVAAGMQDPRRADAVAYIRWRSAQNPKTLAGHYVEANEPEEETYLLEYTFSNYWMTGYFEIPGYLASLADADHDAAYLYLRQALQYLQWQFHRAAPRPWVLKSPLNFGFEASIARNFPDAKFLVLHRDPVKVIPSVTALAGQMRRLYCRDEPDEPHFAAWALPEYAAEARRHMAWRASAPAGQVMDIGYADIQDREMEMMPALCEFLGQPLTVDAAAQMRAWLAKNPQHQHGVHEYSLRQSGLTEAEIRAAFGPYLERFKAYLG